MNSSTTGKITILLLNYSTILYSTCFLLSIIKMSNCKCLLLLKSTSLVYFSKFHNKLIRNVSPFYTSDDFLKCLKQLNNDSVHFFVYIFGMNMQLDLAAALAVTSSESELLSGSSTHSRNENVPGLWPQRSSQTDARAAYRYSTIK